MYRVARPWSPHTHTRLIPTHVVLINTYGATWCCVSSGTFITATKNICMTMCLVGWRYGWQCGSIHSTAMWHMYRTTIGRTICLRAQFQANRFFHPPSLSILSVSLHLPLFSSFPLCLIHLVLNATRHPADTSCRVNASTNVRWFPNVWRPVARYTQSVDYKILNNLYTTMFN